MAQIFLHFSELFMQKESAAAGLEPATLWLLDMSALLTEPLQLYIRSSKSKGEIQPKKMQENLCHDLHFVVEIYFV